MEAYLGNDTVKKTPKPKEYKSNCRAGEGNLALFALVFGGILILLAGIVISVCYGTKFIAPMDIVRGVFAAEKEGVEQLIIWETRLPRVLCAALAGSFLACAGSVMQGITRNPLASPSIMGVNQGAIFAVALFMAGGFAPVAWGRTAAAFAGASVSAALVFLVSLRRGGINITRLLLAGSAMGTLFLSLASITALLTNNSRNLAHWMAGGFGSAGWFSFQTFLWTLPFLLAAVLLSAKITILSLGDEVAVGLGEKPGLIRFFSLICVVILTGAATSVGGNIGFVCLIVPHAARLSAGTDYRKVLPLSLVYGSVLMVYSDLLARFLSGPAEVPVGSITSLLGVPVLIYLIRKERRV